MMEKTINPDHSPVHMKYATHSDMYKDQENQKLGFIYTIHKIRKKEKLDIRYYYRYLGTTNKNRDDYKLIGAPLSRTFDYYK